ncbi:MAG TPA: nitroreductase family protein, partial [Rectinemataceae bacterium]
MNAMDAIGTRVSTRTFEAGKPGPGGVEALERLIGKASREAAPFGSAVKLGLALGEGEAKPARMGTYGLISGAFAFAAAAAVPGPGAFEDLGWVLEGFVLEATALGWDSCWIGGLFDRTAAAAA